MLPLQQVEPAKGLKEPVKRMAALIKGSVPDCTAADFPADPEEACKRLHVFLSVWFPATNNKKEDERRWMLVAVVAALLPAVPLGTVGLLLGSLKKAGAPGTPSGAMSGTSQGAGQCLQKASEKGL